MAIVVSDNGAIAENQFYVRSLITGD